MEWLSSMKILFPLEAPREKASKGSFSFENHQPTDERIIVGNVDKLKVTLLGFVAELDSEGSQMTFFVARQKSSLE